MSRLHNSWTLLLGWLRTSYYCLVLAVPCTYPSVFTSNLSGEHRRWKPEVATIATVWCPRLTLTAQVLGTTVMRLGFSSIPSQSQKHHQSRGLTIKWLLVPANVTANRKTEIPTDSWLTGYLGTVPASMLSTQSNIHRKCHRQNHGTISRDANLPVWFLYSFKLRHGICTGNTQSVKSEPEPLLCQAQHKL